MRLFIALSCLTLVACPGRADRGRRHAEPPLTEIWLWQDQVRAAGLVVDPLAPQPVGGSVITSGRVTFDDLKVAHVMSSVTRRAVHMDAQPGQRRWVASICPWFAGSTRASAW